MPDRSALRPPRSDVGPFWRIIRAPRSDYRPFRFDIHALGLRIPTFSLWHPTSELRLPTSKLGLFSRKVLIINVRGGEPMLGRWWPEALKGAHPSPEAPSSQPERWFSGALEQASRTLRAPSPRPPGRSSAAPGQPRGCLQASTPMHQRWSSGARRLRPSTPKAPKRVPEGSDPPPRGVVHTHPQGSPSEAGQVLEEQLVTAFSTIPMLAANDPPRHASLPEAAPWTAGASHTFHDPQFHHAAYPPRKIYFKPS